jgi:hypothetical protein
MTCASKLNPTDSFSKRIKTEENKLTKIEIDEKFYSSSEDNKILLSFEAIHFLFVL